MRRRRYFDGKDMVALRRLIQDKTGYMPRSNCFLSQAFRRSSYCAEDGGKSNEMFEFVGDQVLSYFTVKFVAQRCGAVNLEGDYAFRIRQNHFSALKQELLSNESFAKIVDAWGIADYLIVGKDDIKNEVHKQTKIKADLFESIIGAVAVDCKWDPVILEKVVAKALSLDARIDAIIQSEQHWWRFDIDNAVTKLKELAEAEQCSQPKYDFAGPEYLGYDKDGDPIWSCNCQIINDITGIVILVYAASKKDAKKAAAYLALCEHFEVANKYGVSQKYGFWIYKNGRLMPGRPELKGANATS